MRRVAGFVLLASLLAACGGAEAKSNQGVTLTLDGQRVTSHGELDVKGQTAEDVDVDDVFFDPTVLSGSGGQQLTITLHNRGSTTHNFSLPEQQLSQDVEPGQSATVNVTFPAFGHLVFFCRFHRSQGMLGVLNAG